MEELGEASMPGRTWLGVWLTGMGRAGSYDGVAIACPVTIPYERYSIRSAHWWIARALRAALEVAGLERASVDGVCVSSFTLAPDSSVALMQHLGLEPRWLDQINAGGACGVMALRRAARAVQCGDAEVVACVAGDTNHVDSFRDNLATFSQFARDAVHPYGSGGPNACMAMVTDHYMREYGATRGDFGKLCVAQRTNAGAFPHALLRKPMALDEYLAARPIAAPLGLLDCVMPCAGAEAFLVMTDERARSLGVPHAAILATIERHNAFPDDPVQIRGGWALDREDLWNGAGVAPRDVDLVQTYDDYPVMSVIQLEDLGFCDKGEGPRFVREHTFTTDGSFPVNTSGGQLSVGQAGIAGGYLGLTEAVRQVTDRALGAAVDEADVALVAGFGMITYDRGLSTAAALVGRSTR